jgi:hypothetical protein
MIDEDTIRDLKAKHGELHMLTSGDAVVIVRKPTRKEYERFRANSSDPNKRDIAVASLVTTVLVHPDRAAFDKMLDAAPGLCEEFAEPVLELVGLTGQAQSAKL